MAFITKKIDISYEQIDLIKFKNPEELIVFAKSHKIEIEPLDVVALCKILNIMLLFAPMDDEISGLLNKDKKKKCWIMKINSLHHPHRQRFTIAHEIAHFIKHSYQTSFFQDKTFFRNSDSNPLEREANQFAAELFMPHDSFHRFFKEQSPNIKNISEHFKVSSMAVQIRAKQLGYKGV